MVDNRGPPSSGGDAAGLLHPPYNSFHNKGLRRKSANPAAGLSTGPLAYKIQCSQVARRVPATESHGFRGGPGTRELDRGTEGLSDGEK